MDVASSSVEAAFRPAFDEIARRKQVVGTAWNETTYFSSSESSAYRHPFAIPEQNFALLSMGTAVLAPRPVDQTRPALRVYGAFATHEEAREHAAVVRDLDATCSLVVVPCREWFMMPQNEACRDDAVVSAQRRDTLVAAWRARRDADTRTFRTRVETHDKDTLPCAAHSDDADEDVETREAEALVYKPPARLRVGAEVRGQNFVALCTVPEPTTGECVVKVLGCFDTADDADAWAQDVATRHIVDDDVLTARTCDWLYPNARHETSAAPRYRINELQRIMDAAAKNPKAVRDYKTWKAEQDRKRAEEDARAAEEDARAEEDAAEEDAEGETADMDTDA